MLRYREQMARATVTERDDRRFREPRAIGGGEAIARLGVIAVLVVLAFVAGAQVRVGPDRWPGWVALALVFVVFAALGALMLWVVVPWTWGRVTRKVWDGSIRIDHGALLRQAGLDKRLPWWQRLTGMR